MFVSIVLFVMVDLINDIINLLRTLRELQIYMEEVMGAKNVLLRLIPMRTLNYTDRQSLKLKIGQPSRAFDHVTTCIPLRKMHVRAFPHPIRNILIRITFFLLRLESQALPTHFPGPHFPHPIRHFPLFEPCIPSLPTFPQSFTSFSIFQRRYEAHWRNISRVLSFHIKNKKRGFFLFGIIYEWVLNANDHAASTI